MQEFLAGKEYVIDKVSLDGEHKLTAIWQYDKRAANGTNFVYFGMKLVSSHSAMAQSMVAYSSQVLDALGIKQGPSHMEVMWIGTPDDGYPCLVEVGSRCHGGEGAWLTVAQECVGYTQVSCSVMLSMSFFFVACAVLSCGKLSSLMHSPSPPPVCFVG